MSTSIPLVVRKEDALKPTANITNNQSLPETDPTKIDNHANNNNTQNNGNNSLSDDTFSASDAQKVKHISRADRSVVSTILRVWMDNIVFQIC